MATRMKPEERREQIVEIASRQFAEHGYRNRSLRQVAAACGMSAPGLMHYFPTLDSLLQAVLQRRDDVDLAAVAQRLPVDAPFADRLRTVLAYYRERGEEVRRFAIVEGEALDPGHPAHAFFAGRQQRNYEALAELLADEYCNADDVAFVLASAFEGLRWQWMMAASAEFDPTEQMVRVWQLVQRLGVPRRPDGRTDSASAP
jgi:AcrR family transcriptional regulator